MNSFLQNAAGSPASRRRCRGTYGSWHPKLLPVDPHLLRRRQVVGRRGGCPGSAMRLAGRHLVRGGAVCIIGP